MVRSELPGRPILYETTNEFLDYFGLSSIDDLPNIDDILKSVQRREDDNKDLYTSKYTDQMKMNKILQFLWYFFYEVCYNIYVLLPWRNW